MDRIDAVDTLWQEVLPHVDDEVCRSHFVIILGLGDRDRLDEVEWAFVGSEGHEVRGFADDRKGPAWSGFDDARFDLGAGEGMEELRVWLPNAVLGCTVWVCDDPEGLEIELR